MHLALRWVAFLLPSILLLTQVLLASSESQFWPLVGFGIVAAISLLALSVFRQVPNAKFSAFFLSILAIPFFFFFPLSPNSLVNDISQVLILFSAIAGFTAFWLQRSGSLMYRNCWKGNSGDLRSFL